MSERDVDESRANLGVPDGPSAPPTPDEIRRVRRSRTDRVLGGVCGGLGRYLGVDPVLLRIAAVALALSGGLGVLAYVIAWVVIPEDAGPDTDPVPPRVNRHGMSLVVGTTLVAVGALLLLQQVAPWFSGAIFWPIVLLAIGVLIVASARR